jgi:hypothetical protein
MLSEGKRRGVPGVAQGRVSTFAGNTDDPETKRFRRALEPEAELLSDATAWLPRAQPEQAKY